MSTEDITTVADKRDVDQMTAAWAGLVVCGLVAAIIWYFGIRAVVADGEVQTSATNCTTTYGVIRPADCNAP